ncbi:MAG: PqqD family protein [Acidobacteria bacterium]|nr:PqqD family protein [Acidobacteriota bacterium]
MSTKKSKGRPPALNWLDLVPEVVREWEHSGDGLVVLLKPKYNHPFFKRHVLPRLIRPNYKLKLDAIGSFIIENCDGRTSVRELGEKLKQHFGESIEPLFDRLQFFMQQLENNRMIRYKGLPG